MGLPTSSRKTILHVRDQVAYRLPPPLFVCLLPDKDQLWVAVSIACFKLHYGGKLLHPRSFPLSGYELPPLAIGQANTISTLIVRDCLDDIHVKACIFGVPVPISNPAALPFVKVPYAYLNHGRMLPRAPLCTWEPTRVPPPHGPTLHRQRIIKSYLRSSTSLALATSTTTISAMFPRCRSTASAVINGIGRTICTDPHPDLTFIRVEWDY